MTIFYDILMCMVVYGFKDEYCVSSTIRHLCSLHILLYVSYSLFGFLAYYILGVVYYTLSQSVSYNMWLHSIPLVFGGATTHGSQ